MHTEKTEQVLPHHFIKNGLTAKFWAKQGEINTQPSKTVPDQTMSLRDILTRYANGIPIDQKIPIYEGEDGIGINPLTLDLAEREALADQFKDELTQIAIRNTPQPKPAIKPEIVEGL